MYKKIVNFIKEIYGADNFIPLHEPRFIGNEKKYINECINSTYVSSKGKFIDQFEENISKYTESKYAIATNSGTSALHISLKLAGVEKNCEVITQPLTFVATCNAINYCNASPLFIDIDKETMGLSPNALKVFLEKNSSVKNDECINNKTGKIIKACVPMHTYGHPCKIDEIKDICKKNKIFLIEDAAESLGSKYKNKHTGTFGDLGTFSFNGNKIITSGGGGCILTNNKALAKKARHLTTTAKVPHKWEFNHDMIGYNYRLPNLNAALLVAQMENLDSFLKKKRKIANSYDEFFTDINCDFFKEPINCKSNYWLNSIIFENKEKRDGFLKFSNNNGVMSRPAWRLMNELRMFKHSRGSGLINAKFIAERLVNIPSSVKI